ncbi:hypothetical protein AMJ83_02920 [candidate division WOR_3 bacterium SM23_42]|uniref:Lysylphosphatidylglycerol synthetase n=1 Tax=candidate division WOR_3 bacterium SM23_42 TaxID=1703779 RepID=A0A0S8FUZ5_UNCW3|nr:MAG: hypothetical protein AMJ83_02920 [candidate division WOR_3 bacterium SM23_42]
MQTFRRITTIAIVVVVFFFLIRNLVLNWSKIPFERIQFNVWLLALSFCALVIYFVIYSKSWQAIMQALGAPITFSQSTWMIATTQIGKYLPGKVWYIVGRVYVGRKANLEGKKLTLSMVLELGLVYITGGIVFAFTTLIAGDYKTTWLIISIMLTIAGITMLHPRILSRVSNFFLRMMKKPEIRITLTYRQISQISLYFFGIWIAQIIGFYLLISAIFPVPLFSVFRIASAYALAWMSGSVAIFAPAGLGVREGIMTLLLSSILPTPLAIAISFIARIWVTIFELMIFFVGLIIRRKTHLKSGS